MSHDEREAVGLHGRAYQLGGVTPAEPSRHLAGWHGVDVGAVQGEVPDPESHYRGRRRGRHPCPQRLRPCLRRTVRLAGRGASAVLTCVWADRVGTSEEAMTGVRVGHVQCGDVFARFQVNTPCRVVSDTRPGQSTSRGESRSGICRLANAPGHRQSSHAATNTVSRTAASWVMLPASASSSKESTRAPLLLLASKI
jgi:hypothetical protein